MGDTKLYIGIDNGVTGSIAILGGEESIFIKTPTVSEKNYTKKAGNISRLDFLKMARFLSKHLTSSNCFAVVERPMINPGRFKAGISAARCLEATLILLELNEVPFQYVDSKEWQKEFLPGVKGSPELKKASMDVGIRLFPQFAEEIKKQKDADGLLMAEWARRSNF